MPVLHQAWPSQLCPLPLPLPAWLAPEGAPDLGLISTLPPAGSRWAAPLASLRSLKFHLESWGGLGARLGVGAKGRIARPGLSPGTFSLGPQGTLLTTSPLNTIGSSWLGSLGSCTSPPPPSPASLGSRTPCTKVNTCKVLAPQVTVVATRDREWRQMTHVEVFLTLASAGEGSPRAHHLGHRPGLQG